MAGGTGGRFQISATIVAGVASLAATLLSIVYVFNHCGLTTPE
jgi:hypothetical protein